MRGQAFLDGAKYAIKEGRRLGGAGMEKIAEMDKWTAQQIMKQLGNTNAPQSVVNALGAEDWKGTLARAGAVAPVAIPGGMLLSAGAQGISNSFNNLVNHDETGQDQSGTNAAELAAITLLLAGGGAVGGGLGNLAARRGY